ncbi:MAG: V-type ATP synthase subunit E family protein [Gemmatimonadales bacterium]
MGLDALLAALEREASAETDRHLSTARAEAERIREAGEARAAALVAARRREVAADHAKRSTAEMTAVVRAARVQELEAQASLLAQVRARTRDVLAVAPLREWQPALPTLLEAGLRFAGEGEGEVEVRCSPAAEAAVRQALAGRADVQVVADPELPAGIEVRRIDNTMRVRLTLPDRLDALWPAIRLAVLDAVGAP